jgi:hypothetical protein
MLTKDEALTASIFYHMSMKNADGTALQARRNGKTQTWKTRPAEFRVPVKHGLYDYDQITERNACSWTMRDPDAFALLLCLSLRNLPAKDKRVLVRTEQEAMDETLYVRTID